MAESSEAEGGPEATSGLDAGAAAIALGLDEARGRRGKRERAEVDGFFAEQRRLVARQIHHLDEQLPQMRLKHFAEQLKVTLQLLAIAAGALVLAFVGMLVWDAAHADGLVVEAFSVPPSLAAQGTTGAVVAGDVLDHLAEIEAQAKSFYASKVSDAWTAGSRIEVPQTGLTLDEVERLFRRQFGHETHITGQVQLTPAGLALTARTGPGAAVRVEGPADQLPALTQQLAEAIHAKARPMTHAVYVAQLGRWDEVRKLAEDVLGDPQASELDKARAHVQMGNVLSREGRIDEAMAQFRLVVASPFELLHITTYSNMSNRENAQGRLTRARNFQLAALRAINRANPDRSTADAFRHMEESRMLGLSGDYPGARAALAPLVGVKVASINSLDLQRGAYGAILLSLHEYSLGQAYGGPGPQGIARMTEDWPRYIEEAVAGRARNPGRPITPTVHATLAGALAHVGRVKDAEAELAGAPLDCSPCLIARGDIAEAAGDHAAADRWYAAADKADPGFPFADYQWGRTETDRGRYDLAIVRLAAAHKTQPRWADPEAWTGRAYALKGEPAAALPHYAEAAKYAPRWGALHLWWGEALARLGRKAEAQAQFAAAATMDLTPAERAELTAQGA
jgi:tetratricopeptide (TPR) repeat protein